MKRHKKKYGMPLYQDNRPGCSHHFVEINR
jgi:hypothetical protein